MTEIEDPSHFTNIFVFHGGHLGLHIAILCTSSKMSVWVKGTITDLYYKEMLSKSGDLNGTCYKIQPTFSHLQQFIDDVGRHLGFWSARDELGSNQCQKWISHAQFS